MRVAFLNNMKHPSACRGLPKVDKSVIARHLVKGVCWDDTGQTMKFLGSGNDLQMRWQSGEDAGMIGCLQDFVVGGRDSRF